MTLTQTATQHQYGLFQKRRELLLSLIQRQLRVLRSLDMTGPEETLEKVENRVHAETFKVLILGEFKRGKSTFINAMLGDEVLPAYARPCTAIINEVKWGDSKRALLHFSNSEKGTIKPAEEIPIEQIEDYVVIQDNVSEIHKNSYEKVELFWPLQLCQNGVVIIDSPGLNEHDIRQKVTMDYLSTVDAILFVMSCEVLASQSEINFIDNNLRSIGHEDIFFICNRINQIRSKERDSIKAHAYSKLEQRTSRRREGIFFIDALGALEGRLDGDENRVYQSGVPQLEEEIAKFLTTQKGRIKILQPARELKGTIHQARQVIPERQLLLQTDLKTLEKRYEDAQEPLKNLEAERQQIVARVSNFIADTKPAIHQKSTKFYEDLTKGKIEEWMKDYEIQEPVKFFKLELMNKQIENVVEEVKTYLSEKLEKEFAIWQSSEMQPFVTSRLASLMDELDRRAKLFTEQVQDVRFELVSGSSVSKETIQYQEARISLMERILAAAGGFFVADFASGALGAMFGFQEMLKSLIPQMAIMFGTILLAGFNPFILIPAMTIGGIAQGVIKMSSTNEKIKKAVTQEFVDQLRASSRERADELSETVVQQMSKIKDAVNQELGKEIQSIRDQVSSILAEKQKGQANVEQKLGELASIRQNLDAIDSELDDLITQVAVL